MPERNQTSPVRHDTSKSSKMRRFGILSVIALCPLLSAILPAITNSGPSVIILNRTTTFQTFTGWEATAQAGQNDYPAEFALYQDDLLNKLADGDLNGNPVSDGLGITRLRIEVVRDPNGFGFLGTQYDLDAAIDTIAIPMQQRLAKRGERLWINICVVGHGYAADPDGYAQAVLTVYQHMRSRYGFVPDSWELALEPTNFGWGGPDQLINILVTTGDLLVANGYTPYFVAPSQATTWESESWSRIIIDGSTGVTHTKVLQYIREISYHRYGDNGRSVQNMAIRAINNHMNTSMLEHGGADYNELYQDLTLGRNSAWSQYTITWPDSTAPADRGGLYYGVNDSNPDAPLVYINPFTKLLRQYMKFIRPSAVRIAATTNDIVFNPVAFINRDGTYVVVVKASAGGTFQIRGLPTGNYGIKYTSLSQYDVDLPDVTLRDSELLNTSIPTTGVLTVYAK